MKKNGFRSCCCLGLVLCIIISLMSTSFAYTNLSSWAENDIKEAELLQILPEDFKDSDMRGYITRGEMAQIAVMAYVKLTGIEAYANRTDYFTDTDDMNICVAYEIGIVNGYPDGTYLPDLLLTRQEFFQIVSNLIHASGVKTTIPQDFLAGFSDKADVSDWASDAAQLLVGMGIVNGTPDGQRLYLLPKEHTNRQEAVVMFLRAYKSVDQYQKTNWLTKEDIEKLEQAAKEEQATEEAQKLISLALSYVGYPYVFGGKSPSPGFDCSGFTYYIYGQMGYTLNRIADDQAQNGVAVNFDELQPGDLILFSNTYSSSDWITHVGIYIGDGKIVHAANTKRGVTVDTITSGYYYSHYAGARRILN